MQEIIKREKILQLLHNFYYIIENMSYLKRAAAVSTAVKKKKRRKKKSARPIFFFPGDSLYFSFHSSCLHRCTCHGGKII